MTLRDVDGGLGYYGRFANPLPTSPDYFPIGAWFRSGLTEDIPKYVDFGMNLFVGIEAPELANEAAIRAAGMRSLIYIGERTRFNDLGSEVAGWLLDDEADMQQGPGADTTNCTGAGYDTMRNAYNSAPQDGKLRYTNYGKGVLIWESDAQARCFVNNWSDVQSVDLYWMNDFWEAGRPQYTYPWGYGWNVERVRFLDGMDGVRHPVWNFIETGWPWGESASQGDFRIYPQEARAAVWHTIIGGARGVLYFDHQFNGPCTESVIKGECYLDTRAVLKATNQQIQQLAPVLNSQFADGYVTAPSSIRAMAKRTSAGEFYVFAGSAQHAAQTAALGVKSGSSADVVGEGRTVPITNGQIVDSFADGNAIHIYRIR